MNKPLRKNKYFCEYTIFPNRFLTFFHALFWIMMVFISAENMCNSSCFTYNLHRLYIENWKLY